MQEYKIIQSLVGDITKENLTFIDTFVSKNVAFFIPIGGSCGYAVTPWHTHPSYMFLLPYDSETVIVLEEKKFALEPKTLFYLSPNIAHHEVQNYYPPKYCAIFIAKDFFENIFLQYEASLEIFCGDIISLKSSNIDTYIRHFISESGASFTTKKDILELIAHLLTHEIVRTITRKQEKEEIFSQNHKINEVVKYINTHFDTNISLIQLASIVALSTSHLSKLFTQEMGISVMHYLQEVRLNSAKKMLLSGSLSVTQVAQQCGFSSPSYFTKLFKAKFHQTPKELLKRRNL